MSASAETLPQSARDQVDPRHDPQVQNDHVRQQANALLARQSCPAAPEAPKDGHLNVGDINHVVSKCAPVTAERDRTQVPAHTEPAFAPTRDHLIALAGEKYATDPEGLKAFRADMAAFEKREMSASPVEVQRTYTQLARILDTPSTIVSDADRMKLAQQVLHEAAHPDKKISQGLSDTCGAASLESRTYTQSPSAAAKMVADLALTGTFTTQDGRTIKPTTGISHPYEGDGLDTNTRNFASQLFQVGTMNIYADMQNQSTNPPGHLRYALMPPVDKTWPFDEHMYDDSTNPPKDVPYGGVRADDKTLNSLYYKITGDSGRSVMLSSTNVDSLEDFKNKLLEASRTGQFPLVLSVYPSNEPVSSEFDKWQKSPQFEQFRKEHPGEMPYLSWEQHAITVQSYDPRTGAITYLDPGLSETQQHTDVTTLAQGMDISLWPDSENRLFDYEDQFPQDVRYKPETGYKYLASLPASERQDEFNKLTKMRLFYSDDFTDAQLAALGLTRPPS
jgi:hypothetical protein